VEDFCKTLQGIRELFFTSRQTIEDWSNKLGGFQDELGELRVRGVANDELDKWLRVIEVAFIDLDALMRKAVRFRRPAPIAEQPAGRDALDGDGNVARVPERGD
jgi:hypothetical protein